MKAIKNELDILKSYLSEDEFESIVKEKISIILDKDFERVFSNSVIGYLGKKMDELLGDEQKDILLNKAIEAIKTKDLSYELFRRPNAWDKSEGYCYRILQKACDNNSEIVERKVLDVFNSVDRDSIAENISDIAYNLFSKNLSK